jgi:hypothetical protein
MYRTYVPLQRWVAFEPNGTSLPSDLVRLSKSAAQSFRIDSLEQLPSSTILGHSLNVIARRLREDTTSTITLSGFADRGEPDWLAYARVESVRNYLETVWDIEPSRIDVRHTAGPLPADVPDHHRLVLITSSAELLAPLHISRFEQDFDPPLLSLRPDIEAEAGVRDWQITMRHDGRVIGEYDRAQSRSGEEMSFNWRIGDKPDATRSALSAELVVEDSTGATATARATVPLELHYHMRVVDRTIDPIARREQLTFTLYPAGDGTSGSEIRNQAVVDQLVGSVHEGARIAIAEQGRGDRAVLADELEQRLKAKTGISIDRGAPVAVEHLLAELPAGRDLSDGARVLVVQPLH